MGLANELVFILMSEPIESYKLGNIQVTVTPADRPNKLIITCFDGELKSEFTVSEYEFTNYRRLMNQRITQAYADQRSEE